MMRYWILGACLLMSALPALAADAADEPVYDGATQRENPATNIPYESGRKPTSTCENRWSDFLPILGKAA